MAEHDPGKQTSPVYQVSIYDEFAEYCDICAFFCDAVTALLGETSEIDHSTIEGAREYANELKARGAKLKKLFQEVTL